MLKWFMPDEIFATYRDITPELCRKHGIRVILTDLDNTLAPYEQSLPDREHEEWIAALGRAGVRVVILSNNHRERVSVFADRLGVAYYADAHKPLLGEARRALAEVGGEVSSTLMMGDQLFTDAWAGRRMKCARVWIVPPIRDKQTVFFRLKRVLERPVVRKYLRDRGLDAGVVSGWPCRLR